MSKLQGYDYIGIDFGTTSSCIATVGLTSDGKPEPRVILDDEHGYSPKMPTAVYITADNERLVGFDALDRLDPGHLYQDFKPELAQTEHLRSLPDGSPVEGKKLAGEVIRALIERVSCRKKPVLCHPAGEKWRNIILEIAKDINLAVEPLSEPLAALYHAHNIAHIFDERNVSVLLIDFGGGTCDLILMRAYCDFWRGLFRPQIERYIDDDRLGSNGHDFGGKDIDRLIVQRFEQMWRKQQGETTFDQEEELKSVRVQYNLTKKAREVKEKLSRCYAQGRYKHNEQVIIDDMPGNTRLEMSMTPYELRELTIAKIREQFQKKLGYVAGRDNPHDFFGYRQGVNLQEVDVVLLTGGSNRFPWIKEEILPKIFREQAREDKIRLLPDPELSVAYGAALYAYDLDQVNPRLPRFSEEDLHLELSNGETYLLVKHGTELPLQEDKYNAFKPFSWPETGNAIEIQLYATSTHRNAETRSLSSEPRLVQFSEVIPKGKSMQMRIYISARGEVKIAISRARLFPPPEIRSIMFPPLVIRTNREKDGGRNDHQYD